MGNWVERKHKTRISLIALAKKPNPIGEEWRDIPGYEGWYKASSLGRIASCRSTWVMDGHTKKTRKGSGYKVVCLYVDKISKMFYVHRLIALTFIGKNPVGKTCVNHKNFDASDNTVKNLEWVSPVENTLYTVRANRHAKGEGIGKCKLTEDKIRIIRKYASFKILSRAEISYFCDIRPTNLYAVLKGRTWKHVA